MAGHYEHSLQQFLDMLQRLDLLIELRLLRLQQQPQSGGPREFRGLYISEEEIAAALSSYPPAEARDIDQQNSQSEQELLNRLAKTSELLNQKTADSLGQGVLLYLPLLANIFELSNFEIDVLVICMAPEVDPKYEKIYAYLQNDVTQKRPTVRLILDLLCQSFVEAIQARRYFSPQGLLFRYRLVRYLDGARTEDLSLFAHSIRVDQRIAEFLLGSSQLDSTVDAFTKVLRPNISETVVVPEDQERVVALTRNYLEKTIPDRGKLVYFLQGFCPVERRELAELISREINLPLLIVDLEALLNANVSIEDAIQLTFREGLLQPAPVYIEHCDRLLVEDEKSVYARKLLFKAIEEQSWLTFLAGSSVCLPPDDFVQRNIFIPVTIPAATSEKRRELMEKWLSKDGATISSSELMALANKFRLQIGQLQQALHMARNLALSRNCDDCTISEQDLYESCRMISSQRLSNYAQKVRPRFAWDDLILPDDQKTQLREICQWVKHNHVVFGDWGFQQKLSLGKGLNVLFAGPSGTGKTMAAEIIAGELGLELYKTDLSMVVSKYIGETEKNLNRLFQETVTSNAILFFDEADALFGKRSEVKDAHDRYANIEINYLLQKMEEHEGIVILATNMQKNLDEAFMRRLNFAVEFPFPDERYRLRIWRGIFPSQAPVSSDTDFQFLAKRLKLSGGSIKNIAINAAFLAAQNSGTINMEHLIFAAKREFQKLGKLCVKSDFEQYYELIREAEEVV